MTDKHSKHAHNHHAHSHAATAPENGETAIDPVCGMSVPLVILTMGEFVGFPIRD